MTYKEKKEEEFLSSLKKVLLTKEGRCVVWNFLKQCKVFNSIWRPSAEIHYLSGKQDIGLYILAQVMRVDEEAFLKMLYENKEKDEEVFEHDGSNSKRSK